MLQVESRIEQGVVTRGFAFPESIAISSYGDADGEFRMTVNERRERLIVCFYDRLL